MIIYIHFLGGRLDGQQISSVDDDGGYPQLVQILYRRCGNGTIGRTVCFQAPVDSEAIEARGLEGLMSTKLALSDVSYVVSHRYEGDDHVLVCLMHFDVETTEEYMPSNLGSIIP